MYDEAETFVENPVDRHAIGDRDSLTFERTDRFHYMFSMNRPDRPRNPTGSPAPADRFHMIMRLYWPTRSILAGTWQPPGVERASDDRASERRSVLLLRTSQYARRQAETIHSRTSRRRD